MMAATPYTIARLMETPKTMATRPLPPETKDPTSRIEITMAIMSLVLRLFIKGTYTYYVHASARQWSPQPELVSPKSINSNLYKTLTKI